MSNSIFTGAGVAIVTPMNTDGSINYERFEELIEFQIANNTDAIIVCGTTGEASTMTDDEHIEVMRFAVEKVAKRVPVIAGTGSNDTAYAIFMSKEAKRVGADALLQVTPYYNKTSQRGLVAHFTSIADAVQLPCIIYNVPSRTGMSISLDAYCELAKHPYIVATKEASGNISLIAEVAAKCGDSLDIYSGNDDQIIPIMSLGGIGVISVLSNCMPKEVHDITQFCLDGDFKKACELQFKLLEVANNMFIDVNPIPVKEAMNLMGMDVGECRAPLIGMTDVQIAKLKASMERMDLI